MSSEALRIPRLIRSGWLAVAAVAGLSACDSVSDVGDQPMSPPLASAKLVGSVGPARSGSEVILSGADSEGVSGPILDFEWRQTAGPAVELVLRTENTVSFTVPDAADGSVLSFDLTVTDSGGLSTTVSAPDVTVVRARDPDQFLSYLSGVSNSYKVVAATAEATDLADDVRFTVTVDTQVTYPDRTDTMRTRVLESRTVEGRWLAATGTGGPDPDAVENPAFSFTVPLLDQDAVNAGFRDAPPGSADRDLILDEWKIDDATLNVVATLTCIDPCPHPTDPAVDNVVLIVTDGNTVIASETNPAAAVATSLNLPADDLRTGDLAETRATAQAYYNTIDPNGERTTLNDWLDINGFDRDLADFGADAATVYVNNYDLGFGREMYIRTDPVTGDVASFVTNYPSLETAAKRLNAFVTVAMEYSPGTDGGDPIVKFYNFVPDGTGDSVRVLSMNFDGRGEKYLPGVCTACHGGAPAAMADVDTDALVYPDGGDVHGTFMPWDLDSFLFTSGPGADPSFTDDPAVDSNALTRAAQEAAFAAMNAAAFCTFDADDPRYATAIDQVSGWYGGQVPDCDNGIPVFTGTFDGTYTPEGWADEADLYHDVYARNCRACHTQFDLADDGSADLQFASYDDFIASATLTGLVYEQGAMPLARLTMDRFWANFDASGPSPAELLASHLEDIDDSDDVEPGSLGAPGDASVEVTGVPSMPLRNAIIRLDASGSLFADSFQWSLTAPMGSDTVLVGDATDAVTFQPDIAGNYDVSLTVNAGQTDEQTLDLDTIAVPNLNPAVVPEDYAIDLSSTTVLDVAEPGVLANDSDADGDDIAVAPTSIIDIDDADRRVLLRADGSFFYEFRGDRFFPDFTQDSFSYRARDTFGAESQDAVINVNLNAEQDNTAPDAPMALAASVSSTSLADPGVDMIEFSVDLSWNPSMDVGSGVSSYEITRTPPRPAGPLTVLAQDGSAVTDSGVLGSGDVEPRTDYSYSVVAVDRAGNRSTAATTGTVTTETSYRTDVDPIWQGAGCTSCHGSSGGLSLSGTADDNWQEIVHDEAGGGPRVNFADIPASDILCRGLATAAGGCPHGTGTKPFATTSDARYRAIFDWISQGAKNN